MKSGLVPLLFLFGNLIYNTANASNLNPPKSCLELIGKENPISLIFQEELRKESKNQVVFYITENSNDFKKFKTCLKDLGSNIFENILESDINKYGVSFVNGSGCIEKIKKFNYPFSISKEYHINPLEITDKEGTVCFGILYQEKNKFYA